MKLREHLLSQKKGSKQDGLISTHSYSWASNTRSVLADEDASAPEGDSNLAAGDKRTTPPRGQMAQDAI